MKIVWDVVQQICVLAVVFGALYSVLAMVSCQERSDIRAYDINKRRIEAMHNLGQNAIVAFAPTKK